MEFTVSPTIKNSRNFKLYKKAKKKTLDKKNIRNKGFYYNYFLVVDSLVIISVVFRDYIKLQILQSPFLFQGCHTLREIREFRKLSNF